MLSSVIAIYLIIGFFMASYGMLIAPRDASSFELLAGGMILMVIWPFIISVMLYNFLIDE